MLVGKEKSFQRGPRKLFFKHILRKIFLEDWAMKLIALLITLALWFGVTGLSTPTTKRIPVPLNLNIASNAQIVNVPPHEVTIEISGDKRKVEQINPSELAASLDLTDMPPGDSVVSLTPDNIKINGTLPQGIRLVEIVPRSIAVNLEAVEEKEINVQVETTGKPAAGYEIYYKSAIPPTIRVRGPASVVNKLEFIQTDQIDIDGKKDGFIIKQVAVSASDPKVAVLNTVVDVAFRIGEKRSEKTFVVPVTGAGEQKASVVLFGPRSLLAKVRPDQIRVEIVKGETGEDMPQALLPVELRGGVQVQSLKVIH